MSHTFKWDIESPAGYGNRMGRYRTDRELKFLRQYVRGSLKILDVGGGTGRFAIPLYREGHEVTVIEESKAATQILATRCPGIRVIADRIEHVAFDTRDRYDLIILMEVILLLDDWSRTMGQLRGLLSEQGAIVFTATNRDSWRTRLKRLFQHGNEQLWRIGLPIHEYYSVLRRNKLVVHRAEGFMWIPCQINSNSILVDLFSFIERGLHLGRWIGQSPWVLFAVKRDSPAGPSDR